MNRKRNALGKFKSSLKLEDEAYILSNYQNMTDTEIADQLKVNIQAVDRFRKKNGLYKQAASYEDTFGGGVNKRGPVWAAKKKEKEVKAMQENNDSVQEQPNDKEKKIDSISYEKEKKFLHKYLAKDIDRLIPKQCLKDIKKRNDFIDKFIIQRRSFNNTEWQDFLSHWMRYMEAHRLDFNIAEDFDDLAGLVRELIIQSNIFEKNKTTRTSDAFYQVYMKQFNESVTRQKKFQENLQLTRKSRKENKEYGKDSFAEVVSMFDNEETRKLMVEADKQDNVELLGYMDKIRRKMKEEGQGKEEIDGQESSLLMNMDEDKVNDINSVGIKILEEEDVVTG